MKKLWLACRVARSLGGEWNRDLFGCDNLLLRLVAFPCNLLVAYGCLSILECIEESR